MPKKKNFLGGQQNYNPNNGQYEPALKGPNGESPSQFSSFKKEKDESFDAINQKRMGREKAHKESDENAEIFNDYKEEYTQAYKEGGEKGLKDAVLKSGYTTDQYKYALEQLKGGSSEELSGDDLVDEFQDRLQSLSNDYNVGLQDDESTVEELKKIKADLESKKNLLGEEQYKSLSEEIDRQIGAGTSETNSFEEINAKRTGKSTVDSSNLEVGSTVRIAKEFGDNTREFEVVKVEDKPKGITIKEKGKNGITYQVDKSQLEGYEPNNYSDTRVKPEDNPETYINEQPKSEEPKKVQYFKHPEVDGVWHDTGKTVERNGNTYKIFENEEGGTWGVSERFAKQFQPFDKNKKTELLSKDYLDKFYELAGGDEDKMLDLIRKDPAYQNNDADPNDTWSMGDLEGIVGAYFEKRSSQNKNNSFDKVNSKRLGK